MVWGALAHGLAAAVVVGCDCRLLLPPTCHAIIAAAMMLPARPWQPSAAAAATAQLSRGAAHVADTALARLPAGQQHWSWHLATHAACTLLQGYSLGPASLQFEVTIKMTAPGRNGTNTTASLTLSPSVPLARSSAGELMAKLLGDLASYTQLPVLR
jgi:hypothetical protein